MTTGAFPIKTLTNFGSSLKINECEHYTQLQKAPYTETHWHAKELSFNYRHLFQLCLHTPDDAKSRDQT